MKKLTLMLLSLVLAGFAGSAMAGKPDCGPATGAPGMGVPTMANKPEKSTILHCGCEWDDLGLVASMVYKEITISSKSRGHDGHVAGTIGSCYAGQIEVSIDVYEDVFVDFVRNGDDCQLSGPPLGDPILDCTEFDPMPVAGDPCGVEVID